jgi:UDP-glucuronate decarboxylase
MIRKPLPADDPMQRKPDITLAKKALGWEPGIDLEAGLRKTIAYFETLLRDELKAPKRRSKAR